MQAECSTRWPQRTGFAMRAPAAAAGRHSSPRPAQRRQHGGLDQAQTVARASPPTTPECVQAGAPGGRRRRSWSVRGPLVEVEGFQRRLTSSIHHAPTLGALRDVLVQYQGEAAACVRGCACVWRGAGLAARLPMQRAQERMERCRIGASPRGSRTTL